MKISRLIGPIPGIALMQLCFVGTVHAAVAADAPLPSAPMPKGLNLSQVYIKSISVIGTGCRQGNFEQNLSDDKRAFTLTFSEFNAEIGPGIDPGRARRNCNVTLNLNIPAGYQYTVGTFNYRGHMILDAGVKGELATNYFFSGVPAQGTYSQSRLGEFNDDYIFTDAVGFTTAYVPGNWSPCEVQRPFSINSTITLSRIDGNTSSQGAISNESIDGELVQQFGLAYRRCGDTTVPNPTNPDPTPEPTPPTPDPVTPTPPVNPTPVGGIENGRTYNIINRYSGQCFDVRDYATYSGASLQQWNCTGDLNQKFKALYQKDGSWHLVGIQSGKYVSVENGWAGNGNGVLQSDYNGADYQKIIIERTKDGFHKMKFRHSNKCVDIEGPSFNPGAKSHQWDCFSDALSQDWLFVPERPAVQEKGEFQLVSRRSGKCFEVSDYGTANGVKLQQWSCTKERYQKFRVVHFGQGVYSLVGVQSGKTVSVRESGLFNDADIIQWDDHWASNQRIILTPSLDGSFQVRFRHSGKCMDLDDGNSLDGGRIHQWDCQLGNPNQDWFLRP